MKVVDPMRSEEVEASVNGWLNRFKDGSDPGIRNTVFWGLEDGVSAQVSHSVFWDVQYLIRDRWILQ